MQNTPRLETQRVYSRWSLYGPLVVVGWGIKVRHINGWGTAGIVG